MRSWAKMNAVTDPQDTSGISSESPWVVIVPIKRLAIAKSRLGDTPPGRREQLALAFALDTISAVQQCCAVSSVVVVTDDEQAREAAAASGATVLADAPNSGLNPALSHAAAHVRGDQSEAAVLAISADLPALRFDELDDFLDLIAMQGSGTYFVRDVVGTGTTLLASTRNVGFVPQFGPRSAAAHAHSGGVALDLPRAGLVSLHRDVDTDIDLWDAVRLGVGPHTAEVLTRNGERLNPLGDRAVR